MESTVPGCAPCRSEVCGCWPYIWITNWDTPIALQNVYQLANLKGITYQAEVLDWNGFKAVQRAFIEAGVPDIELPTDIAIMAVLHRTAASMGFVPFSVVETLSTREFSLLAGCTIRDSRYSEAIVRRYGLRSIFSLLSSLDFARSC